MSEEIRKSFTPTHHALLFGWLGRAVVQAVGHEQAEVILRKAVRRYASQRGRRMAQRAQRDGQALTMLNYMVYGEWRAGEGEMQADTLTAAPHLKMHVNRCPWSTAWRENDLLPYGRYYCMEVDEALVRSFNPELRLDVDETQSGGGECCDFTFFDANLTPENAQIMAQRKQALGNRVVMAWDYHTGHLYKTVTEVMTEELGAQGEEAARQALADFAQRYGEPAAQIVLEFLTVDFNRLPDEK